MDYGLRVSSQSENGGKKAVAYEFGVAGRGKNGEMDEGI